MYICYSIPDLNESYKSKIQVSTKNRPVSQNIYQVYQVQYINMTCQCDMFAFSRYSKTFSSSSNSLIKHICVVCQVQDQKKKIENDDPHTREYQHLKTPHVPIAVLRELKRMHGIVLA